MKKKLVVLLAAVCAVSMLGGCGSDKKNDKKSDKKESKSTVSIDYNASDYVTLGDYLGMQVALDSNYEVTDDDVKSKIETLIASYPAYEDTDKTTVENGDFVNIDYEGLKDGVAFDGGTAKGTVLEIGSNKFIDGFESGLIGANVGDTVSLNLTFPENYQSTELAGQAVVFNVTINKIVTKQDINYDNITDQYVADNFSSQGYETVQALKDGVKEQLTKSNESTKETDTQSAILEKLQEVCTVNSLPDGVLDQRVKDYKDEMEKTLKDKYNMSVEDYLSSMNETQEEFDTEVNDYMQKNLEVELILTAIADKEGIEVDEDGYKEYINNIISNGNYADENALMDEYGEDYVKNIYRNNKAMDLITEKAVVTYGNTVTE
ncbi:trigger factor [Roseburia sp. MSJ-14]|uniref:trigger factor n=1 Tax=Roseburia sp. MSJ-14 TaxID=2841514 RepID=UPI001C10D018|nr:trigger factor [Roseburia sp. MSJ-14]MBU5473081.1 trigger factor [Roseburia sp. MSJ-14]